MPCNKIDWIPPVGSYVGQKIVFIDNARILATNALMQDAKLRSQLFDEYMEMPSSVSFTDFCNGILRKKLQVYYNSVAHTKNNDVIVQRPPIMEYKSPLKAIELPNYPPRKVKITVVKRKKRNRYIPCKRRRIIKIRNQQQNDKPSRGGGIKSYFNKKIYECMNVIKTIYKKTVSFLF